ncbi:hypothetical protein [Dyadobacter sp. 3J3]|uniref:hypothetical protein n=1 Tax=Dyadobacter sp. 3J3 TaxID=2606600 RepID=UPI0013581095|nr:hypothetical protein [Dyadobacter sp. 3J3]
MSKRLIRIASKNIASELTNLAGLNLNAILQTGNTYFGKLISVTNEHLTILDTRQHTHRLAIRDLFEVVYDQKNQK